MYMLFDQLMSILVRFGHQCPSFAGFGMSIGYPGAENIQHFFFDRFVEPAACNPIGIDEFPAPKRSLDHPFIPNYILTKWRKVIFNHKTNDSENGANLQVFVKEYEI